MTNQDQGRRVGLGLLCSTSGRVRRWSGGGDAGEGSEERRQQERVMTSFNRIDL